MNTPNFAEICWGDYILDGRIIPYKNYETNLTITDEEESVWDYMNEDDESLSDYIDEVFKTY